MSKHQELCMKCTYDNIDNEWYREECGECTYEQLKGDVQPSNYVKDEEYAENNHFKGGEI